MTKKTFLYDAHVSHSAKMINFAGYTMPVWYSSMKEEHLSVRNQCGMFDISHMGVLEVSGADAFAFLQRFTCNDATKSLKQKMTYSMVLNEEGFVLDDVMFAKLGERFILVVNSANREKLLSWFKSYDIGDVVIKDLSETNAFIAIQGPKAIEQLASKLSMDLSFLKRFSIDTISLFGEDVIISRTGYTGEDGVELIVPSKHASDFWDSLIEFGIAPCGLAARDSLRIEAGFPLYGHELSEKIHPLMTRYKWVIAWDTDFIGKEALISYKESTETTTVGIEMFEKMIPRQAQPIQEGGEILSGTLSPLTQKAVGMALVPKHLAELGNEVTVQIRNKECRAKVVAIPFY
jgi:aminomethyltransferase